MSFADYEKYDHLVLSLGGGVQSSAIAVMAYADQDYGVPEPDQMVFADTGNEPAFVYNWLSQLENWLNERGGEIEIVQKGNLRKNHEEKIEENERFASIPAFADREGQRAAPLRRQCTREYKIEPIEKHVKSSLGFEPGQHMKGKVLVGVMLGISVDEVERIKQSDRTSWTENVYPLIDQDYTREECKEIYEEHDLPTPKKSSCNFCPYHSDRYWKDLKENHPEEFKQAVEFDKNIRDMSKQGVENKIFLHRSCQPLDEVDFEARLNGAKGQKSLFEGSCGAFCGV